MTRTQRSIELCRQGDACIRVCDPAGRPCAGARVWAEQEAHDFRFGCAPADLGALSDADRRRYGQRRDELFAPAGQGTTDPDALRVDVTEWVPLGVLRLRLEQLGATGRPVEVHVCGTAVGDDEGEGARRAVELYTLCFAQPAVCGIVWHGFRNGLLRQDLSPRPAYRYLEKLIHVIWHTRADARTDAEGLFRFRGFFGDYRVAARLGDRPAAVATLSLRRGGGPPFPIVLR